MTVEAILRGGPTTARALRRCCGILPGELLEELKRLGAVRYDRKGSVLWKLKAGEKE